MNKVKKIAAAFWRDSRPAVYAMVAATGLAAWKFVHAGGFPKTHADWMTLGWAALAAGLAAGARAADPMIAKLAVAAVKVATGGTVVSQAEMQAIIAKAEQDAAKQAGIPTAQSIQPPVPQQ